MNIQDTSNKFAFCLDKFVSQMIFFCWEDSNKIGLLINKNITNPDSNDLFKI